MTKPKPSWPIRTPGWMITRSPTSAFISEAPGPIEQLRPMRTPGPITALAPTTVSVPISAPGPTTTPGSSTTPLSSRADGVDGGARRDAFGGEQRRRPQGLRKEGARDGDEGAVGVAHAQDGEMRRRRRDETRRHQAGAGPRRSDLIERIWDCRERRDRAASRCRAARRRKCVRSGGACGPASAPVSAAISAIVRDFALLKNSGSVIPPVRIRGETQIHFRDGHCDPPRCEMNTAITGREPMPRCGMPPEVRSAHAG